MFNKAHYLIRLENDPDQHMAGNNQKYDVKKISRQVVIKLTGWMYFFDFLQVQARCAKYSAQDSRQVNYHSFSFSRESNKPTLKKSFVWDIFSVVQALCKHTFKDHESATEAQCKHIASWQCEHLWSTIKSTACVHLCVRSSRRKTRGPVAEGDHARAAACMN